MLLVCQMHQVVEFCKRQQGGDREIKKRSGGMRKCR